MILLHTESIQISTTTHVKGSHSPSHSPTVVDGAAAFLCVVHAADFVRFGFARHCGVDDAEGCAGEGGTGSWMPLAPHRMVLVFAVLTPTVEHCLVTQVDSPNITFKPYT